MSFWLKLLRAEWTQPLAAEIFRRQFQNTNGFIKKYADLFASQDWDWNNVQIFSLAIGNFALKDLSLSIVISNKE